MFEAQKPNTMTKIKNCLRTEFLLSGRSWKSIWGRVIEAKVKYVDAGWDEVEETAERGLWPVYLFKNAAAPR